VVAYLDDDDNDNTVGDANGLVESAFDLDNDGIPNHLDLDSDDDSLFDLVESGQTAATDANMDGRVDDPVSANGLADVLETSVDSGVINYSLQDSDGDTSEDYHDFDDDNDHVLTINEHPDDNANHYPDDALDTDADGTPDYLDVDDDGDGIYTVFEDVALPHIYPQDGDPMNDDTDGDGIPNYLDTDDDNDGILTIDEHPDDNGNHEPDDALDTDGDFIPDYLDDNPLQDFDNDGVSDDIDIDDDNDGILDVDESGGIDPLTDADNDGIPVYRDDDDNDNSVGDVNGQIEPAFNIDGDIFPNHLDSSSDNDNLYDLIESGRLSIPVGSDVNNDGVLDGAQVGANGLLDELETTPDSGILLYSLQDTDGDGIIDALDDDDDGDHVSSVDEFCDPNADHLPDDAMDTDLDGIPNYLDPDDDNDGIYTIFEDVALPHIYPQDGDPMNDDTDGDGIPNYLDVDDDDDGILTINEHPDDNGNHEPEDAWDSDNDLIPDYLDGNDFDDDGINDVVDLDDDNDGIPDVDESGGLDPLTDADNDGVPLFVDDDDNDNTVGNLNGIIEPAFDLDGDGMPNHLDVQTNEDALFDTAESGRLTIPVGTDSNMDGMLEGDVGINGIIDELETYPDSGVLLYTILDTDGDGIIDAQDDDDDNDHVLTDNEHPDDNVNNYPDDALDTDADGISDYLDVDDDGDGINTIFEDVALPHIYPQDGDPMNDDTDGDGIPNYLDPDDDNDSILTIDEHPDDNGNHEPDDALDIDHDGIPDYLDDYDDRELIIYTAISPNGNGKNDYMHIESVEKFPENSLIILNRWQNKVWEGKNYDNVNVKFEGKDQNGNLLPTGTYYYLFEYNDEGTEKQKAGYIYILK
jgi:heat shock protein beta